MTEQRKRKLKNKIEASRSRLMISHPYLALLLMHLKYVAIPDMKKISTNGRCVYFSPQFIEKLYDYELDYILSHQIMHIVFGHIWRTHDLAGESFHYTCDIFVNSLLFECGFEDEKYPHFGKVKIKNSHDLTNPVELPKEKHILPFGFHLLDEKARSKFFFDSDIYWDKTDNGYLGDMILDTHESESLVRAYSDKTDGGYGIDGNIADNEAVKQAWRSLASAIVQKLDSSEGKSKGAGIVPHFMRRVINNIKEPYLDWKKLLNNFLQERICDYSFSPPDRRYSETDFFLPDFNEKEYVSRDILFMVDTSGSVKNKELSAAYSEIKGAIEQFDNKLTGKVGFFDVSVKEPMPFENVDDLLSIIPYGGGGTDFSVIFEYIKDNYENEMPACVVIFTDGDGPYPGEEDAMNLPVLWIINNLKYTPPFGIIIRMLNIDSFN